MLSRLWNHRKKNGRQDTVPIKHTDIILEGETCEPIETQLFTNEELLLMFGMADPLPGAIASPEKSQCMGHKKEQETLSPPQTEKAEEGRIPESARQTIARINEMKESEPAFCSAIEEGSKCFVSGNCVEYHSPLKPICGLLKKYFEVFSIPAKACFDPSIKV